MSKTRNANVLVLGVAVAAGGVIVGSVSLSDGGIQDVCAAEECPKPELLKLETRLDGVGSAARHIGNKARRARRTNSYSRASRKANVRLPGTSARVPYGAHTYWR